MRCEAVNNALNSCASVKSNSNFFGVTIPQSDNISSQNTVSSASSTTIPIFATHSALERARQAAR